MQNHEAGCSSRPLPYFYAASSAASMAPIVTPYPRDGSDTSTWVTAPTSLPFCIMGLPLTSVSSRGQNFFPPGVGNTVAEVPLYTHRAARFNRDPPDERGGQPQGKGKSRA